MEVAGVSAEGSTPERVWTAAAAARAWTAAAHHVAVWESCRSAWIAMSEASAAGRNSAEAGAEAVGRDGVMNGTAFGNGAAALEEVVRALARAGAAFSDAAEKARLSAAEWEQAASMHAMAGDAENAALLRKQAGTLRDAGQAADNWAAKAESDAGASRRALRRWRECADRRANGRVQPGYRDKWIDDQSRIHADSEYSRVKWADKAEKAYATAQRSADQMQQYADLAGRMAVAAGLPDDIPPGAEGAAVEWKKAIESARRVSEMQAGVAVVVAQPAAADHPGGGEENRLA